MLGVDDVDFPEVAHQFGPVAQVIDQVADGHVLGHRDEVAAHQAAGGLFRISERALDRDPVLVVEFGENRLLVFFVEILDQLDRVIGLELFGNLRHRFGGERFHHVVANPVVEFGDDIAGHQVGDGRSEGMTVIAFEQFEQVGDVGRMERFDEVVGGALVVRIERIAHCPHEVRLEPVFLVVPGIVDAVVGAALVLARLTLGREQLVIGRVFGFAHSRWSRRRTTKSKPRVTYRFSALYRPGFFRRLP